MRIIIIISLLFISNIFSQDLKFSLDHLFKEGDLLCDSINDISFCKALDYYKQKKDDSCYIYSSKALLVKNNIKKRLDILYYLQASSAIQKGLYKKAKQSLYSISETSSFMSLKNKQLGVCYLSLKKYDSAIYFFKKFEDDNINLDGVKTQKDIYHNLGLCYIHTKKYEKAEKYFDKELSLLSKNDTLALVRSKMDLANVYYNQYLDDKAIPLFQEAYDLAKNYSDIESKRFTSENMGYVEKDRKRFDKSVDYFIEAIKWKDSLWNRDRIIELADRDKKLTVAQKDKEIAIQESEIKQKEAVQRGLLLGASGLLLFLGGLGFFYSKLKKQNSLITQQKEELTIANKTKNYLFSVVSHDLRSPMNTIKYQHEQLKKHIADNNLEGIEEANNTAITVTESTSHLLNNVLHWSLEQSNQMVFAQKEYPLKPIVEHVLYDYEHLIEANAIEISTNYIQNSIVKADRESIKIVLRNLLDNAVKYMNGQGKISVEMGVDDENYGYIAIQDTGIGIPKDRLEKINALKGVSIDKIDRSEGVGLGLILCQTLVKKNKGILSFDSEVGKGTKVTIQLPIADE